MSFKMYKNGKSREENYKEIQVLDKLLTDEDIPHIFREHFDGYQVVYPHSGPGAVLSAIEFFGSYGSDEDTIEIMGLTKNDDSVEGYLTAQEVFDRIKRHYTGL